MASKTTHGTHNRAAWSGKAGFILAGAASAVGLGNLWRFPTLAAKYGGGMFILTYFVLAFTFGISLLLLETALGRHTRQSVIGAFSMPFCTPRATTPMHSSMKMIMNT